MYTVGQLKDSVAGLLQGTNLDNVTNLNGALERAARILVQKAYIKEASARHQFMLFKEVYDYRAPELIFDGSFVDMRPQGVDRSMFDQAYKTPIEIFDQTKIYNRTGYNVTFEYVKGTPIMRISSSKAQNMSLIDNMAQTTGWTAQSTASSIARDTTVYYKSPASIRFNVTGVGTGTLTKTLTQALNLATYQGVGTVFLALRTPSTSLLSSIRLRIGSSASNYREITVTQAFTGAIRSDEFVLLAFDLSTGTDTGTPNWSAINYVQLGFTHTASITNLRIGYLFASLPYPTELLYQTSAIFLGLTSNTLTKTIQSDNDYLTLNDGAYLLYEHESAITVALQNGGSAQSPLIQMFTNKLDNPQNGLYMQYRAQNPSEEIPTIGSYY